MAPRSSKQTRQEEGEGKRKKKREPWLEKRKPYTRPQGTFALRKDKKAPAMAKTNGNGLLRSRREWWNNCLGGAR